MRLRWSMIVVVALLATSSPALSAPEARPGRRALAVRELVDPAEVAIDHLVANRGDFGLSRNDVSDLAVSGIVVNDDNLSTVVYLQQQHGGVPITNAVATVVIDRSGEVRKVFSRFVAGAGGKALPRQPKITPEEAKVKAEEDIGRPPERRARPENVPGAEQVPEKLVLVPDANGDLTQAWEVTLEDEINKDWLQIRVDAETGEEIERVSLVDSDSYEVYAPPLESPDGGGRTVVLNPADPTASPFGWHDTDGVAGADSTLTLGNNVSAYTDTDDDNLPDPGSQPDGGATLDFSFPIDLAQDPSTYRDADVTNMFFWTNHAHDVFYRFGFDEAAGNFQVNNYGNGGVGGDAVLAEAQDSAQINNANFVTPPEGFAPRMQMFIFDPANPDRSASLDNTIVVHEYAHGVSNRLTAGANNVTCLDLGEQPGEGWSDYFGLTFTMEPTDVGTDARPFGTYVLGQPPTGAGLRAFPYSTDLNVDPRTYGDIATAPAPHGVGSIFAAMLWDMTWMLIDRDGFAPDLINGTGGNITAMQLVMDGMKLQPCNPGFVDARDAILLADDLHNGAVNECLIWSAFAKRGLGFSADQGSSLIRTDGVEAFDLPPQCQPLTLTKAANPAAPMPGDTLTYTLTVGNLTPAPQTGVTITDTVPAGTAYVPGSATCGGSLVGNDVVIPVGTIAPSGGSVVCSFQVVVDPGPGSTPLFADDFEAGTANWTIDHVLGVEDWVLSTANPQSPVQSVFAVNPAVNSDQRLTLVTPVAATTETVLRFWHDYDTETAFDGGVVEVSTDGGTNWTDLGPSFVDNGYPSTLNGGSNPINGRPAFNGFSNGYLETSADLSSFAGSNVLVRFWFGSDGAVGGVGWHVDDVRITDEVQVINTATAASNEGFNASVTLTTVVAPFAGELCAGLPVTVDLGSGDVPTSGDDVILGTENADLIDALGGNDVICGLGGNDTINGMDGDDRIFGDGGDDEIDGGDGWDELEGGAGDDRLKGGKGNDVIRGGPDNDEGEGGQGDDRIWGDDGNDTIEGDAGADIAFGGAGIDTIHGDEGNDRLFGQAGNDTINGNLGDDTVDGGTGHDILNGNAGDDILLGYDGADVMNGGAGDDYLWGGLGIDTFNGGDGSDELDGADGGVGEGETMNGDLGDDRIFGFGGDDTLDGGGGADFLSGGTGADTLIGGADVIDICTDPDGGTFDPTCEAAV